MKRLLVFALAAIILAAAIAPVLANANRGRSIAPWNVWTLDPSSPSYLPRDHMATYWGRDNWVQRSVKTGALASTDCFYLIGGRTAVDPNDPLNSDKGTVTGRVERFNPQTNIITVLPDLPHPRMNAAVHAQWFGYWKQDPNNPTDATKRVRDDTLLIFVFGGTDGQGNAVTAVDVFNTQTQNWNDTSVPVLSLNDPANPGQGNPAYWDNSVTPAVLKVMVATDTNDKITDSGRLANASDLPVPMEAPVVIENGQVYATAFQDPINAYSTFHIISGSPTPVYYRYSWVNDTYTLAAAGDRPGPLPTDMPAVKGASAINAYDIYGGRGGWYGYFMGGLINGAATGKAMRGTFRHMNEGWTAIPDMPQPVYWAAQMTTYMRPWICTGDQTDMPIIVGGNIAPGVYSNKVQGYVGGPYRQWFMTSPTDIFPFGLDMPEPRGERPGVGVFQKGSWWPSIWVFGGQTAPGVFATTILRAEINSERYIMPAKPADPVVKGWQYIADMPTPREGVATAVVDGKMYVIGGATGPTTTTNARYISNACERYDPATDTWQVMAPMMWSAKRMQAAVIGKKIYVVGGKIGDSIINGHTYPVSTTFPLYTPYDTDWGVKPPNPVVSNNILQIYDTETNTWTSSLVPNADGSLPTVAGPYTPGTGTTPPGEYVPNPDCPPTPVNCTNSAVCVTADGLIHEFGGRYDDWGPSGSGSTRRGGVWNSPYGRQHQVYDPVAKKWYRNVRELLDPVNPGPFLTPENAWGHRDWACDVIPTYDENGVMTHEWIYLYCGGNDDGDTGRIYRMDWMAVKNLDSLWTLGWGVPPDWMKMIPVSTDGVNNGSDFWRGFAGNKADVGHAVITDRHGVSRIMTFGGQENWVDWQSGGTVNKDELYPNWRLPVGQYWDGIAMYAYHSPEEVLPVSDCTTYEGHMPMGRRNRPAVAQIGNRVYIAGGCMRGKNPSNGNNDCFPQATCYSVMINNGDPSYTWYKSKISDFFNCPLDYTAELSEAKVVTRVTADGKYFWIEEDDRSAAMKVGPVDPTVVSVASGDKVKLSGSMKADSATKELTFIPTVVTSDLTGQVVPKPVALGTRAFIGARNLTRPGRPGGSGANNTGLLARIYGNVTAVPMAADSTGLYCYIDDGSGLTDGTVDTATSIANKGIRVYHGGWTGMDLVPGKTVSVGGIVTFIKTDDGKIIPALISDELISTDSAGFIKIYN